MKTGNGFPRRLTRRNPLLAWIIMVVVTLACMVGGLPKKDYAEITNPTQGAKFEEGYPIQFAATVSWQETGVSTQSVTWNSSRDGVIGEGNAIVVSNLSVGTHQIEVTALGGNLNSTVETVHDWVTIEVYESSNRPEADLASRCYIPSDQYAWSYEDIQQSTGSGGTACNARFVFQNDLGEAGTLIVFTTWDNNAMESAKWSTFRLEAGSSWEYQVSKVLYENGDVTFSQVGKILLIRSTTECTSLLSNENEAIWDERAVQVEALACE